MPSKDAIELYKRFASSVKCPVSGRISDNRLYQAVWQQRDFLESKWTKYEQTYLPNQQKLTTIVDENTLYKSNSPSGKFFAVLKQFQEAGQSKESKNFRIELWDSLKGRMNMTKLGSEKDDKYGETCMNGTFGGFVWDEAEENLAFVAESKIAKSSEFVKASTDEEFENAGKASIWKESWGEQLGSCHRTLVCVYNIATSKVKSIDWHADYALSNPQFCNNHNNILFIAQSVKPYRLGRIYCTNKYSKLVFHNTESGKSEVLLENAGIINLVKVNARKFLFQQREIGLGPHWDCYKLMRLEFNEDFSKHEIKILVDYVKETNEDFNGIYSDSYSTRCLLNENTLVFSTMNKSKSDVFSVDLTSGKVEKYDLPEKFTNYGVLDVHDGQVLMYCSAENIEPSLAVHVDGKLQILESGSEHDFSAEIVDFKTDGTEWQGVFIPQENSSEYKGVILRPHGGPHSIATASFSTEIGYLAKLGYAQMIVNYRGSLGFGFDHIRTLPGHCSVNDVDDCMTALMWTFENKHCPKDKAFLTGGSHGGFLTCHLIGQFPDVFKAAVTRNPVTNVSAMVGVTDIPDWCWYECIEEFKNFEFKGEVANWCHPGNMTEAHYGEMFRKSPMFHVNKVKTPLLLQIGEDDARVPPSQGIAYYRALKSNEVDTEIYSRFYITWPVLKPVF